MTHDILRADPAGAWESVARPGIDDRPRRARLPAESNSENRLWICGDSVPATTRNERHAFAGVLVSELRGSVILGVACIAVLLLVLSLA